MHVSLQRRESVQPSGAFSYHQQALKMQAALVERAKNLPHDDCRVILFVFCLILKT